MHELVSGSYEDDYLDVFALLDRPAWHRQAACRSLDTDLFFPERGGDTRAPRVVCETCSVRAECLEAGLLEKFGIWGGEAERGRRRVRSQRGGAVAVRAPTVKARRSA